MQKNPFTEKCPSNPPDETVKNVMVASSRKEGGADHKKDSEKTRS
jgi:hypothetical protein